MKQILILILFISFSLNSFGQQPESPDSSVTKFYVAVHNFLYPDSGFTNRAEAKNLMVNGLKEGKWIEYITLSDTGDIIVNDKNAPYYRLAVYVTGKPIGVERTYYKGGKLYSQVFYKNGVKNGVEKQYYKNGKLEWETPYINDSANGICKGYYENGKVLAEIPYKDWGINGIEMWYYKNGKIWLETHYINGLRNGAYKHYYKNGNIDFEATYINGKEIKLIHYDKNGNELKK